MYCNTKKNSMAMWLFETTYAQEHKFFANYFGINNRIKIKIKSNKAINQIKSNQRQTNQNLANQNFSYNLEYGIQVQLSGFKVIFVLFILY